MVFSFRSVGVAGLSLTLAALSSLAWSQAPSSSVSVFIPRPLLPSQLDGWAVSGVVQTGTSPEAVDAGNADVLKEYGLKDFAEGEYRHGSGQMKLRALHFVDATGAYGALTFYRKPGMHTEKIGDDAASDGHELVFRSGMTLVDAVMDHADGTERAALKDLATGLPKTAGPEGTAPSLPHYLPAESLDASSVRYAIGPTAYLRNGGVLPPEVVDFSRDAEAVTAQYHGRTGHGTLTILEYPTPQMALDRSKAIETMLKGSLPSSLQDGNPAALAVKHSGPLVAVTSGAMSPEEARLMLDKVKYEAAVTWNHPEGYVNEVRKTARFLLGVTYLTGVLGGGAILLGLFLGGGRALIRVMRGKSASTMNEDQFISLNLRD